MNQILVGAIVMASLVASLFFLRYWKSTNDRFFLFFALSFLIEAVNRLIFWSAISATEEIEAYFLIRLAAYALILIAIIDKNRPSKKSGPKN